VISSSQRPLPDNTQHGPQTHALARPLGSAGRWLVGKKIPRSVWNPQACYDVQQVPRSGLVFKCHNATMPQCHNVASFHYPYFNKNVFTYVSEDLKCIKVTFTYWQGSTPALLYFYSPLYRVIHNFLRDFRPLRYSSRDGHVEVVLVNRRRDIPSFCPTLRLFDLSTLGDAAGVNFWQIPRHRTLSYSLSTLCFVMTAP
jgi:hypothetical protein